MDRQLRIVHCFRSPVGGIFRHVRDLARAQSQAGHQVGILCDSSTGGAHEERLFEQVMPDLQLGLTRVPMKRAVTPGDLVTLYKTFKEIKRLQPDVLHSHGAKGGAYARMIGSALRVSGSRVARLYCPHGGSIHYDPASLQGKLYFAFERFLERFTDRLIFVSGYERDGYRDKIGEPRCGYDTIYNGLTEPEFEAVPAKEGAAEFLYIGMMRDLKGPDLFIEAIAALRREGRAVTAHFVGDGPDKEKYISRIGELGLGDAITVHDAMPARQAFALAEIVVVPSRAESMPYLVLEAIAASKPVLATNVGGIPEIYAERSGELVTPDSAQALTLAMARVLENPDRHEQATAFRDALHGRFSVQKMASDIEAAYRACA